MWVDYLLDINAQVIASVIGLLRKGPAIPIKDNLKLVEEFIGSMQVKKSKGLAISKIQYTAYKYATIIISVSTISTV